jgi:hypothetical protein
MECSSMREKLSAYLDDAVSREERDLIEEHLGSCAECSSDLADLRKTVQHLKGLEEVEPPAWMTQKIMAELREEVRRKKGILGRLFYPLYIKLPLEAVAAVLVVGIALYVYRGIGPETRFEKAPPKESAPQILQREIIKEDKIGPYARGEVKKVPGEVTGAPVTPVEEPASGKTEVKTDEREAAPKTPEPPAPTSFMQEERQEAPSTPADEAARSAAGSLKKAEKREAVQAAPKLKAFSEEKTGSLVLTVKVRELESAGKEVEKIIVALEGRIIERQSYDGRQILVVDLRAAKIDELFERLKLVGDVGEKGPSQKGREETIRVRIEAVQAQKRVP